MLLDPDTLSALWGC